MRKLSLCENAIFFLPVAQLICLAQYTTEHFGGLHATTETESASRMVLLQKQQQQRFAVFPIQQSL